MAMARAWALLVLFLGVPLSIYSRQARQADSSCISTFSIVAWDSVTGDLGICTVSGMPAVGAVVPFARADVGAIAAQGEPYGAYGDQGLDYLFRGTPPQDALDLLTKADSSRGSRQVALIDAHGVPASFTGPGCAPFAGAITEHGVISAGTCLPGEGMLRVTVAAFDAAGGDIAGRLVMACQAGLRAPGGARTYRSAALLVVRAMGGYGGYGDRFVDLRVDDDPAPMEKLAAIYTRWADENLLDARLRSIEGFNRLRKFDVAREELKRIVALLNEELRRKPDDPETLRRIASVLAENEIDRDRALELAKRAATLAPNSPGILSTLAECHYRLGHFDEAIAIASRLVEMAPANDLYWRQLRTYKEAQQHEAPH